MSIPFPLNDPTSPRKDSDRTTPADAPSKPFRAPVLPKAMLSYNPEVIRALYSDNKELVRALLFGLAAICIIAGSIVAKTAFVYATLALMVISIFGLALVDTWGAISLFIVYLTLEGMYKYTSNFNPVVYSMTPLLAMTIFVAWRLRTRHEGEQKQSAANAKTVAKGTLEKDSQAQEIGLPKVGPWVLALIALGFIQAANPDSSSPVNSLSGAMVWYIMPMSFFFIAYYALKHRKEAMGFMYGLLVTGFVVSGYAVVQFYLGKEWVYSHVPGMQNMVDVTVAIANGKAFEEGAYRPASTFAFAGGYVGYTGMAMLSALSIAVMPRMVTWRRILALLSVTVMTMALSVSNVRLAVLTMCVLVPVLLSLSVRRFEDTIRIYFMVFVLGSLIATSFVIADGAAKGKLSKRYLGVFTSNPLSSYKKNRGGSLSLLPQAIALKPFGTGVQRETRGQSQQFSDHKLAALNDRETQFNAIHNDLGVFGLISLIGFYLGVIVQGAKICRTMTDPNLRSVAVLMYVIFLSHVIGSFGGPALQSGYVFWIACGILFALPRIVANERKLLADSRVMTGSPREVPARIRI